MTSKMSNIYNSRRVAKVSHSSTQTIMCEDKTAQMESSDEDDDCIVTHITKGCSVVLEPLELQHIIKQEVEDFETTENVEFELFPFGQLHENNNNDEELFTPNMKEELGRADDDDVKPNIPYEEILHSDEILCQKYDEINEAVPQLPIKKEMDEIEYKFEMNCIRVPTPYHVSGDEMNFMEVEINTHEANTFRDPSAEDIILDFVDNAMISIHKIGYNTNGDKLVWAKWECVTSIQEIEDGQIFVQTEIIKGRPIKVAYMFPFNQEIADFQNQFLPI